MVLSCDNGSGVLRLVDEMVGLPGKRKVGRPRKTWTVTVKRDLEVFGVNENVAFDRRWRKIIASPTST